MKKLPLLTVTLTGLGYIFARHMTPAPTFINPSLRHKPSRRSTASNLSVSRAERTLARSSKRPMTACQQIATATGPARFPSTAARAITRGRPKL